MSNGMWINVPKPATLNKTDKETLFQKINDFIKTNERLSKKINRIEIKAGRVYFYSLYEVSIPKYGKLIKPLIEGKYLEEILGRITLYDKDGQECRLAWQRYNDDWMELGAGTLDDCLRYISEHPEWF